VVLHNDITSDIAILSATCCSSQKVQRQKRTLSSAGLSLWNPHFRWSSLRNTGRAGDWSAAYHRANTMRTPLPILAPQSRSHGSVSIVFRMNTTRARKLSRGWFRASVRPLIRRDRLVVQGAAFVPANIIPVLLRLLILGHSFATHAPSAKPAALLFSRHRSASRARRVFLKTSPRLRSSATARSTRLPIPQHRATLCSPVCSHWSPRRLP